MTSIFAVPDQSTDTGIAPSRFRRRPRRGHERQREPRSTVETAVPVGLTSVGAAAGRADGRAGVLTRMLVTADLVALGIAAVFVHLTGGFGLDDVSVAHKLAVLVFGVPLWLVPAVLADLYGGGASLAGRIRHEPLRVFELAIVWSFGVLVTLGVTGVDPAIELTELISFVAVVGGLLLGLRSLAHACARGRRSYRQTALVVGTVSDATPLVRRISRDRRLGIDVVACLEPGGDRRFAPRDGMTIGSVPVVPGGAMSAPAVARSLGVDRVFVAGHVDARFEREVLTELADLGLHVDVLPQWVESAGGRIDVEQIGGVPILTARPSTRSSSGLAAKRAVDVAISAITLIALSPVLAICALAIKLDSPGPVLFRQRRVGRDDRRFEVFKFRSMHHDAELRKAEVARLNLHGGGNDTGMFKIRWDPRITRVGGILRRYSLDELPQLLNVLRGEMSIVGPRPLIENEDRQIGGHYRRRTSLSPGLTGPWQVHGRSEIPFEEMLSLDLRYVRTWSLSNDLQFMAKTVPAVLRGRGAY